MDSPEEPPGAASARTQRPAPRGGQIEPLRGSSASQQKAAKREPQERYEVRDPFSEVVYHAKRIDEIKAKAEQLGSHRFTAIDAAGRRTLVRQADGQWTPDTARHEPGRAQDPTPRDTLEQGRSQKGSLDGPKPSPPYPEKTARAPHPTHAPPSREDRQEADPAHRVAQLEAALNERYVVKRATHPSSPLVSETEYRFRGNTARVAFTETTFRLATDINNPSVARSMVDVAEARGWRSVRVTGNEEFKRQVWIEASVRGVHAVGYEPTKADLAALHRDRTSRQVNRLEPIPEWQGSTRGEAAKASGRSGGRKAVLAAIEAILVAKKVPEVRREAIMAAATEKLAQRTRDGIATKVRVYDVTAPSQRQTAPPQVEPARTRERAGPTPSR